MPKVRFNKLKGLTQEGGDGFFVDSLPSLGVSGSSPVSGASVITAATATIVRPGVYVLSKSVSGSRVPSSPSGVTVTLPSPADFPGAFCVFRDGCLDTVSADSSGNATTMAGIKAYGRGQTHFIDAKQKGATVGQIVGWGAAGSATATHAAQRLQLSQSFYEDNAGGTRSGSSVSLMSDGVSWRVIGQLGGVTLDD